MYEPLGGRGDRGDDRRPGARHSRSCRSMARACLRPRRQTGRRRRVDRPPDEERATRRCSIGRCAMRRLRAHRSRSRSPCRRCGSPRACRLGLRATARRGRDPDADVPAARGLARRGRPAQPPGRGCARERSRRSTTWCGAPGGPSAPRTRCRTPSPTCWSCCEPDRARRGEPLERAMREAVEQVPGVSALFTTPLGMRIDEGLGGTPADLSVRIFGPDPQKLADLADAAAGVLRGVRGVSDVRAEPLVGLPQLTVQVDREAAARVGLTPGDVIEAVQVGLAGRGRVRGLDRPAAVRSRGQARARVPPRRRRAGGADGRRPRRQPDPARQARRDRARVRARHDPARGRQPADRRRGQRHRPRSRLGGGRGARARCAASSRCRRGTSSTSAARSRARRAPSRRCTSRSCSRCWRCSCCCTSRSARWPRPWSSSRPCRARSSAASSRSLIAGETWSVSSLVGLIGLFGIAVQNGLVLVTQTRGLVADGRPFTDALREACIGRVRPKIMTASTAILGLLPLMVLRLHGTEIERPLAIVMVGGLVTSTLFTLLALPAFYQLVHHLGGRRRAPEPDPDPDLRIRGRGRIHGTAIDLAGAAVARWRHGPREPLHVSTDPRGLAGAVLPRRGRGARRRGRRARRPDRPELHVSPAARSVRERGPRADRPRHRARRSRRVPVPEPPGGRDRVPRRARRRRGRDDGQPAVDRRGAREVLQGRLAQARDRRRPAGRGDPGGRARACR